MKIQIHSPPTHYNSLTKRHGEMATISATYSKVLGLNTGDRGRTVVKVLCYKSEGRWFDSSWCQWVFH